MKLGNIGGRAGIILGDKVADVATVSEGRFGPDPMCCYRDWDAFAAFASTVTETTGPLVHSDLRNPVPRPAQVFAVGFNYRRHVEELGMPMPDVPAVFTKFPASLAGPYDSIEVAGEAVDWEVELVAVIGRAADRVAEAEAWSYVAGLTVGQDISDRHLQYAGGSQFSLGKSRRGYGPIGPWMASLSDINHIDDLAIGCSLNGQKMQDARTDDLIFTVPQLVTYLSAIVPLQPGDLIFTGTPSGIGAARQPPVFLQPGDVLESWVEQVGTIRNTFVAPER